MAILPEVGGSNNAILDTAKNSFSLVKGCTRMDLSIYRNMTLEPCTYTFFSIEGSKPPGPKRDMIVALQNLGLSETNRRNKLKAYAFS